MSYLLAGVDVHKKKLAVVVDAVHEGADIRYHVGD